MVAVAGDIVKNLLYKTRFARWFCITYDFQYMPPNLCLLAQLLKEAIKVQGTILEVGCFRGATTVWLCKYLETVEEDRRYFALDTFSGFVEEHATYEEEKRKKSSRAILGNFSKNSQAWFDKTMEVNNIKNVTSIKADASVYDYSKLGPIAFALIDVDLYVPVRDALNKIFPLMSPGGVIAVDDCKEDSLFDGAREAYLQFVDAKGLPRVIENSKIGIIRNCG